MAVLCSYNLPSTCFLSFSSFRAEIADDWLCQISQTHPKSYILLTTCFHEFTNFFTNIWKSKQISYWSKKANFSQFWAFENIKINITEYLVEKKFVDTYLENSWKHVVSLTLMVGGWAKPEPEMAFISITSSASSPISGFSMVTFVSMASGLLILILMWISSNAYFRGFQIQSM